MKLQFTTEILNFLLGQGFRHCYSRTTLSGSEEKVTITLTPAYSRPDTQNLPKAYDRYLHLSQEPRQMATGLEGVLVLVLVELKREVLVSYFNHILPREAEFVSVMNAKR